MLDDSRSRKDVCCESNAQSGLPSDICSAPAQFVSGVCTGQLLAVLCNIGRARAVCSRLPGLIEGSRSSGQLLEQCCDLFATPRLRQSLLSDVSSHVSPVNQRVRLLHHLTAASRLSSRKAAGPRLQGCQRANDCS